jgi:hypothetical protein
MRLDDIGGGRYLQHRRIDGLIDALDEALATAMTSLVLLLRQTLRTSGPSRKRTVFLPLLAPFTVRDAARSRPTTSAQTGREQQLHPNNRTRDRERRAVRHEYICSRQPRAIVGPAPKAAMQAIPVLFWDAR